MSATFDLPQMKFVAASIIIVFVCFCSVLADVAPDPGFKRVSVKLIVETSENLDEYRFFVKSGADLEEVFVKTGSPATISPIGGGAYYSSGKLLAVPKTSLTGLNETATGKKLNNLQQAVYDGKVEGKIDLLNHSFSREVAEVDAGNISDAVYRIDRDPQVGLRAVYVSGGVNPKNPEVPQSSGRLFWQGAGAAIVAGIFLAFGITILGVLYFRKRAKEL